MGRWKSGLVARYAGEALATGLVDDMALLSRPPPGPDAQLVDFIRGLESRLEALEEAPDQPIASGASLDPAGSFVVNSDTKCLHWTRASPTWPNHMQRANCGWPYFKRRFERLHACPPNLFSDNVCDRCLPQLKASVPSRCDGNRYLDPDSE